MGVGTLGGDPPSEKAKLSGFEEILKFKMRTVGPHRSSSVLIGSTEAPLVTEMSPPCANT